MVRVIGTVALVLAAGCVDKASEDGRSCPCGDGRTCCFDVCLPEADACAVEDTIGLGGGTLTAPNGAILEIPFGALEEDTVIRMRSVEPEPVDGITFVGGAVALEPEGLALREGGGTLTLPFDIDRIPSGSDPDDALVHRALAGSRAYQRDPSTEVTATTMSTDVTYFMQHVPAVSRRCPYVDYSNNGDACFVQVPDDGTIHGVECQLEEDREGPVECRCLEDGVETRTVQAPCGFASEVFLYECGFACPDEAPPVMPDAGPTDAAPPI